MENRPSKPWFAPKTYGYGSGLPIAWQGWVTLLLFVVILAVVQIAFRGVARTLFTGLLVAALMLLCALKTEGGWRWRWGNRD